jgi:hypothetical protein
MKHATLTTMALLAAGFCAPSGRAQQPKESDSPKTITGCLLEGAQPDRFVMKDQAGTTYQLFSTTVPLKMHLGHQVKITASPLKHGTKGDEPSPSDPPSLEVAQLTMISTTCK